MEYWVSVPPCALRGFSASKRGNYSFRNAMIVTKVQLCPKPVTIFMENS